MKSRIHLHWIKPSSYDDDGCVDRYFRGVLPSNTLACLTVMIGGFQVNRRLIEGCSAFRLERVEPDWRPLPASSRGRPAS